MSAHTDDALLARAVADEAGRLLTTLRSGQLRGRELKDAGDRQSHELTSRLLRQARPADLILSEEDADDRSGGGRAGAARVWIVDPLDGTREFSEPPRQDWAVHVALCAGGELVAGAVALPAVGTTYATDDPPAVPAAPSGGGIRIAVSRTRPPAFVRVMADDLGAELLPMGSAGVKCASIWRGEADAYVHGGGQYEWDSAAPVAVARAAGLHTSRLDGSPLEYNRPDPLLPDLLVCRPELAAPLLSWLAGRESRSEMSTR